MSENRFMDVGELEGGKTLPWSWYVSDEVLRLERDRIFRGAWAYACPASWVAEAGEFVACAAGDVPIVVVRNQDGDLGALVNVCRHRGSQVVSGRGSRETLQCSYHAWTYALDGTLRAAPRSERESSFDPSELSLRPARVETWGPFVFVNADARARPLAEMLGSLPELLRTEELVFRERVEYGVEANWKIAVENFLECYHCPVAHPDFSKLVDTDPDVYALEEHDGIWSQLGRSRDGGGSCQFHLVWPALKVNVYPGMANLSIGPVWPVGTARTAGFLDYFFGPDVSDAEARELIAFDDQVGREDAALIESVQRGVRSGVIEHGRLLLDSERLVDGFQKRVFAALS